VRKAKKSVRLSERKDTKRILAIYRNVLVVIPNGILKETAYP
jgi:hypothetical protein